MNKSILVAALLAVALTACGKKPEAPAAAPAPAVEAAKPAVPVPMMLFTVPFRGLSILILWLYESAM